MSLFFADSFLQLLNLLFLRLNLFESRTQYILGMRARNVHIHNLKNNDESPVTTRTIRFIVFTASSGGRWLWVLATVNWWKMQCDSDSDCVWWNRPPF
jgi:hypothetical protein